jgi:hypothetical protein
MKLTIPQLQQLLSYVHDREREGWYYGNKEQFEKRHEQIKTALYAEIARRNGDEGRDK